MYIFVLHKRRKMSVKIQELEDLLEQQRQRAANLEKTKNRLIIELREVTIELENVSYNNKSFIDLGNMACCYKQTLWLETCATGNTFYNMGTFQY